jgi:transcriptional regulator with XRE-family HTH domain
VSSARVPGKTHFQDSGSFVNYSKAIRTARALADISQRELAKRVSIDASLVSMIESGKRKPSLDTLENIATALGIPFHLFTLLASEPADVKGADSRVVQRLAVGLSKLLLGGDDDEARRSRSSRKAPDSEPKSARRYTQNSKRKAG